MSEDWSARERRAVAVTHHPNSSLATSNQEDRSVAGTDYLMLRCADKVRACQLLSLALTGPTMTISSSSSKISPHSIPHLGQAMIESAVALVTSSHCERKNVMTVSFFAESSHVPALLRVSISLSSLTHELITESGWFGLSLLARGQEELALACGTISGRQQDKFARLGLRYRLTGSGVPLLPGCLTTSECRVVDRLELSDHTLFIGSIISSYRQSALSYREALLVSDLIDYLDNEWGDE
jgi:flavin reductase (DIM6/NTAB) family NADH-FMN oxidoreductase RutF